VQNTIQFCSCMYHITFDVVILIPVILQLSLLCDSFVLRYSICATLLCIEYTAGDSGVHVTAGCVDLAAKENELDRLLSVCSSSITTLKNAASTQYPLILKKNLFCFCFCPSE